MPTATRAIHRKRPAVLAGAKVLIADDHLLFRRGFMLLFQALFPDAELVGAGDAGTAYSILEDQPDIALVLLDLGMPGMNGLHGVRRFVDHQPTISVVILSAHTEPNEILDCIALGARAYIPKTADELVVENAIRLVMLGEVFIPSQAIQQIKNVEAQELSHQLADLPADNPLRKLTKRQCDTLALMMEGQSNKEVARRLGLLESTVKAHVKVILKKLAVHNRTQAALVANDLGWPRTTKVRSS